MKPAALAIVILPVLILVASGCGSESKAPIAQGAATTPIKAAAAQMKGQGRVPVEHGLDADVAKVNTSPVATTVEELLATRNNGTSKIDLAAFHDRRMAPFETTTFEVKGTIESIKHEKDGDFYFVLKGKTGAQAIIEVPDPALCKGSPLLPRIQAAREALDKRFHPTEAVKTLHEEITVDGVGFLGSRRKPGSGSFGSSVRLMPGTGVSFSG